MQPIKPLLQQKQQFWQAHLHQQLDFLLEQQVFKEKG